MPDFDVRYGDSDKQPDWRRYEEPDKDDDAVLSRTPKSVVEMLGFDPLDFEESKRASDALPDNLVYGPFTTKSQADVWAVKLRRKGFFPRVNEWGRLPTSSEEAQGIWIGDPRLSHGWGVFVNDPSDVQKIRIAMGTTSGKARDEDGAHSFTQSCQDMMDYHALPVRVENLAGAPRGGITPDGESWHINMPADYGFIENVCGADGDNLDCYIGASPESNNVYVVDQLTLDGKRFDEHKVLLGYHTLEAAKEDYLLGHHKSSVIFAAITPFTMPMFRRWLRLHDMKTPCGPEVKK